MMIIVKAIALVTLFHLVNYIMNAIEETVTITMNPEVKGI